MASSKMQEICSVADCDRPRDSKGLCTAHYYRQKRNVSFDKPIRGRARGCSVANCGRRVNNEDYCGTHWLRLKTHGDVLAHIPVRTQNRPRTEVFWSHVAKTENPDDCWLWTGPTARRGYGLMYFDGKRGLAHRYALSLRIGRMPEMFVLHSCDTPQCVNPNHLREGTQADNVRDMVERGRNRQGSQHPRAKLTEDLVRYIRASPVSTTAMARELGVSYVCVLDVRRRKRWADVE